jgi:Glycosyl transferase family 2
LPESLTACVIARDEEERLPACLQSLAFCDEIVVVDSGSRDRTVEIAREAGARVVENPWPGFAAQRNVALDHARSEWVLEIDADERVSPELAAEVRALLADPPPAVRMAAIPRREVFLGRMLGPSTRAPRYGHRLFRRGAYRHDEARTVHEGLWPDSPVVPLEGEMEHLLASTWREALGDALAYARLEAGQRSRPGGSEALVGILLRPAAKLVYRLFLLSGWRDGPKGWAKVWLECAGDALATVYRLRGTAQEGAAGGFGQSAPRLGPVRIVGVALGPRRGAGLAEWLDGAAAAGADVSLISPGTGASGVRTRVLAGAHPGKLARALDAEDQLRPVDAVLPAGRRERLWLHFAPRALRGVVPPLDPGTSPAEAARSVASATRGAKPT